MAIRSIARSLMGPSASALACALATLPVLLAPAVAAPSARGAARVVTEPTPPRPAVAPAALLHQDGTHVRPKPGAPKPPRGVSARSWLVADAGNGDVLGARNAHLKLPPASTIKTLFALTALPKHAAADRHRVTEAELKGIGEGSSLVGVSPGHSYRVADLWRGVFLSSGNDAVRVLAAMNGGWKATARQMEAKARELGARDTKVVSPDGYDAPGQVSSAFDLAVFGHAGLKHPDFRRYSSTASARFPSDGATYDIHNTNRLLTGADGVERYPGIIGIKNGYTSGAGHTLVAAAERAGRTLVVSVMNPQKGGGQAVYEEARKLLDWGFEAAGRVRPVGSLVPPQPQATAGAGPDVAQAATAHSDRAPWAVAGGAAAAGALALAVGAFALFRRRSRARRYWGV
ncbi:D-alanyl-D-alanine carboxypeptidase family protein [Streptomyces sp. NPDC002851]